MANWIHLKLNPTHEFVHVCSPTKVTFFPGSSKSCVLLVRQWSVVVLLMDSQRLGSWIVRRKAKPCFLVQPTWTKTLLHQIFWNQTLGVKRLLLWNTGWALRFWWRRVQTALRCTLSERDSFSCISAWLRWFCFPLFAQILQTVLHSVAFGFKSLPFCDRQAVARHPQKCQQPGPNHFCTVMICSERWDGREGSDESD